MWRRLSETPGRSTVEAALRDAGPPRLGTTLGPVSESRDYIGPHLESRDYIGPRLGEPGLREPSALKFQSSTCGISSDRLSQWFFNHFVSTSIRRS